MVTIFPISSYHCFVDLHFDGFIQLLAHIASLLSLLSHQKGYICIKIYYIIFFKR
jgi:hypothetical protein